MSDMRFSSAVRSVIQLQKDSAGNTVPVEIYRKPEEEPKKGSRMVRPVDRAVRRMARAQEAMASRYLERHDRSNAKERDGWLRDLNTNVTSAARQGQKALKLSRIIFPL